MVEFFAMLCFALMLCLAGAGIFYAIDIHLFNKKGGKDD